MRVPPHRSPPVSYHNGSLSARERLLLARRRSGETQAAYAEKLGVSPHTLWRWENSRGSKDTRALPDCRLDGPVTSAEACWLARERAGLTQRAIAAALHCSTATVINGERGHSDTALGMLLGHWQARGWPETPL